MTKQKRRKPDFLIIGAPRAGTSWLWEMLDQHPGTDLPKIKEPFFFGSVEVFRKGMDWYYDLFKEVDPNKVTGEGSTSNFYDRIPYFWNKENEIVYEDSLPVIPKLITDELPDIKVFICLRDPVARAISHYGMVKSQGRISPFARLKDVAEGRPKMRIVLYGHYAKYFRLWQQYLPPERMCVLIFEEDILKTPEVTLRKVYSFLGLDPEFKPSVYREKVNKTNGWTRIVTNYYLGCKAKRLTQIWPLCPVCDALDRFDPITPITVTDEDIEYLRSIFVPEKAELEQLVGRSLDCWYYGR
jgi:hypothetical protein